MPLRSSCPLCQQVETFMHQALHSEGSLGGSIIYSGAQCQSPGLHYKMSTSVLSSASSWATAPSFGCGLAILRQIWSLNFMDVFSVVLPHSFSQVYILKSFGHVGSEQHLEINLSPITLHRRHVTSLCYFVSLSANTALLYYCHESIRRKHWLRSVTCIDPCRAIHLQRTGQRLCSTQPNQNALDVSRALTAKSLLTCAHLFSSGTLGCDPGTVHTALNWPQLVVTPQTTDAVSYWSNKWSAPNPWYFFTKPLIILSFFLSLLGAVKISDLIGDVCLMRPEVTLTSKCRGMLVKVW